MAVLNLTTLRSELGVKIKRTTIANARLDRWLNMAVDDVLQSVDSDHMIQSSTITMVSGTRLYYVPDCEYNKILSVVDTTTDTILELRSEYNLEEQDPDLDDAGSPLFYAPYGYTEYEGQPLTASTVSIVSTSASDTTQTVRIPGVVNSVDGTENLTLNGLTTVTGTASFSAIHGARKSATTVGRVRVTVNDASTTRIADIAPASLIRQYQPIYLFPVPNAANSMRVRYIRKPRAMVNAEDIPDVSSDQYHELVLIGAAIRGHRDLFDHVIARKVLEEEWVPMVERFKKQQGNKRGRKSPVIGGNEEYFELGRLPNSYGYLE